MDLSHESIAIALTAITAIAFLAGGTARYRQRLADARAVGRRPPPYPWRTVVATVAVLVAGGGIARYWQTHGALAGARRPPPLPW
jgi:hypothetical protein